MSTQNLPAQSSPNGGTWVVVWVPLPPSPHIMAQSMAYKLDPASSANNANIQLCTPSRNNAETIQHTCPIDWANKPSLGTSATDYSFLYQSSNASLVAPVPTPTREPTQPTQNRDTAVPSPLGSNMEEAIDRFIESLDSCTAHDVDWNVFSPPGDGLLVPEQISLANHDSLHGASPYTEPYMSATSSPGSSQSSEYTMYPCTEPTCQRSFPSLSIRNKHHRKHSKPFACSVCGKGHSAKRDLHRHLWVKHPEYAERNHVPSQTRKCGFVGCTFEGRQDNLARHIRKLHGV